MSAVEMPQGRQQNHLDQHSKKEGEGGNAAQAATTMTGQPGPPSGLVPFPALWASKSKAQDPAGQEALMAQLSQLLARNGYLSTLSLLRSLNEAQNGELPCYLSEQLLHLLSGQCALIFGIEAQSLITGSSNSHLDARAALYYLFVEYLGFSFTAIARRFDTQTRTVIYHYNKVLTMRNAARFHQHFMRQLQAIEESFLSILRFIRQ